MDTYDEKALQRIFRKIKERADECLIWQGAGSAQKSRMVMRRGSYDGSDGYHTMIYDQPKFKYRGKPIDPQHVVWALHFGLDPFGVKYVRANCPGGSLCLNVEHLAGVMRDRKPSRITCDEVTTLITEQQARGRPLTQPEIDAILDGDAPRTAHSYEEVRSYLDNLGPIQEMTGDYVTETARGEGFDLIITDEHIARWLRENT